MKQLTTLKLLGFVALSITAFPAFTMEKGENNDNKNQHSRKFMNYNKLLALSEKNNNSNKQRPHKVTCYKLVESSSYIFTPIEEKKMDKLIEEEKMDKLYKLAEPNKTTAEYPICPNPYVSDFSFLLQAKLATKDYYRNEQSSLKEIIKKILEVNKTNSETTDCVLDGITSKFTTEEFSLTDKEFNNPENWIE